MEHSIFLEDNSCSSLCVFPLARGGQPSYPKCFKMEMYKIHSSHIHDCHMQNSTLVVHHFNKIFDVTCKKEAQRNKNIVTL